MNPKVFYIAVIVLLFLICLGTFFGVHVRVD